MSKEKIIIPIRGMHCRSCEILVQQNLEEIPEVEKSNVDFKKGVAEIVYGTQKPNMREVENAIRQAGYSIGMEEKKSWLSKNPQDYKDLGIAFLFLVGIFVVLNNLGLTNISLGSANDPSSLGVVFLVGITAGVSTCMALVGGLILGISARHSELHPEATAIQKFRPHLFFNLGRIFSFAFLGGLLAVAGKALQFSGSSIGFFTIIVGVVMLFMGIKLLGIFPKLEKYNFTIPKKIGKILGIKNDQREYSHFGSAVFGGLTFFLPCGFTQTMQLLAISSGNFLQGSLIMGIFALGTAPGLLGIGGLTSAIRGIFAKRFFKFAGMVVILMASYNISSGYVLSGLKNNNLALDNSKNTCGDSSSTCLTSSFANTNESSQKQTGNEKTSSLDGKQIIKASYTYSNDITPSKFTVKVGQSVNFVVDVLENGSGCMSTIMVPGLYDKPQLLQKGKTIEMDFTPSKKGVYQITCAMGVPRGTITVE